MSRKDEPITWFAAALIEYRDKHQIRQDALARDMGIPVATLCRWEQSQWPRLGNFCRACRDAGIDPMELLEPYFKEDE
jgi:transcriptional regulator with XRE-family HTH domain